MARVIIFGTGDIAELAFYYLKHDTDHQIAAFTVDDFYIKDKIFCNLPLVGFSNIEKLYSPDSYKIFIALSYTQLNKLREKKYLESKNKGYSFISYISPRATIYANATIGENCFIFENNTIQPFVTIGNNVTLWSGNHIGHHSTIKDHCFISSHVVVSGGVVINPRTFIGVNSTLRDHISIGADNVIGAGSIIMHDTKDNDVYVPERTRLYKKRSFELERI